MSANDLREKIAESFINALNEDKIPWEKMWQTERAYNATNQKDYRGVNALWLAMQAGERGYTDPRWCTFKQAKDKGWSVRKGEKGTSVEFWSMYDKKTKKTLSISEANEILKNEPEREDDLTFISKRAVVFNAAQIDGIPKLERTEPDIDIKAIRGQRDTLLQNMDLAFKEGGDRAFYRPSEDRVTMPPEKAFPNDYAYMSTFLHECGHATSHPTRLNRTIGGTFGSESYAKEELRAEIASAFTSQALGFKGVEHSSMDNHKAYIQSWVQVIKDKPNELFAAIKDAEKIADYLIEKGQFKLPEKSPEFKEPLDEQIKNTKAHQEEKTHSATKEHGLSR